LTERRKGSHQTNAILIAATFFYTFLQAQEPHSISGKIADEHGRPQKFKNMRAVSQETGRRFRAGSGSDGSFVFSLPPGKYNLWVERDGFQQPLQTGVSSKPVPAPDQLRHRDDLNLSLKVAPPDQRLFSAKTIYVVNQTPEKLERAIQTFTDWNRYSITDRVEDADLVVIFLFSYARELYQKTDLAPWDGRCIPAGKRIAVRMAVYDRKKKDLLYVSPEKGFSAQWKWAYSRPSIRLIRSFKKKLEAFTNCAYANSCSPLE
jgi:hypothetical protein